MFGICCTQWHVHTTTIFLLPLPIFTLSISVIPVLVPSDFVARSISGKHPKDTRKSYTTTVAIIGSGYVSRLDYLPRTTEACHGVLRDQLTTYWFKYFECYHQYAISFCKRKLTFRAKERICWRFSFYTGHNLSSQMRRGCPSIGYSYSRIHIGTECAYLLGLFSLLSYFRPVSMPCQPVYFRSH